MFFVDSYGSFSTVMKDAIAKIGVNNALNMVIRFELKALHKMFAESPIQSRIISAVQILQNTINKNKINNEELSVSLL